MQGGNKVESLSELKSRRSILKKAIQKFKASHDFYLAMWKSAPYAIIAMFPISAYTYLLSADYSGYFIGAVLVAVAVTSLGLYGWSTQKKLSEQIAQSEISLEDVETTLHRRIAKVEAEFISSKPSTYLASIDNMSFDSRLAEVHMTTFRDAKVPQLLRDMECHDGDLMVLLDEFDRTVKGEHAKLVKYCLSARAAIAEVIKADGEHGADNPDIVAMRVKALYLVLCDIIGPSTVLEGNSRPITLPIMQNGELTFVRQLFASQSRDNKVPSLLGDSSLRALATDVESVRRKAEALRTTIEHIVKVKFEDVPSGFGVRS
jgi:hypothetical protein